MNIKERLKRYASKKIQLGRLKQDELLDACGLHDLGLTTLTKGRIITLTPKGVEELKRLEGRNAENETITKQRAEELMMLCNQSAFGPNSRCENIKPETEGERARVKKIWNANPSGLSSYYSTLCDIRNGRVQG